MATKQQSQGDKAIREMWDKGYYSCACGTIFNSDGIIVKGYKEDGGYLKTRHKIKGKNYTIKMHRLSAYVYYGDAALEAQCIRHLNGIKSDNSRWNISYGTYSDNRLDIPKEKRSRISAIGCMNYRKKIATYTITDIKHMKKRYRSGDTIGRIAADYNLGRKTVRNILSGNMQWVNREYATINPYTEDTGGERDE